MASRRSRRSWSAASTSPRRRPGAVDRAVEAAAPGNSQMGQRGAAVSVFAPGKVNLYLHVVGRRPDGYHLLDSLIAFADIGDRLTAAPAASLSLAIRGAEAGAIAALGEDNLGLRAARPPPAEAAAGRPGGAPPGAVPALR